MANAPKCRICGYPVKPASRAARQLQSELVSRGWNNFTHKQCLAAETRYLRLLMKRELAPAAPPAG